MRDDNKKKDQRVTRRSGTGMGTKKQPIHEREAIDFDDKKTRGTSDAAREESRHEESAHRDEPRKSAPKKERSATGDHTVSRKYRKEEPTKQAPTRTGGDPNRTVHQLVPYALVCLAPFAAISFVLRDLYGLDGAAGAFGNFLADFLCGLFGVAGYAVPFFMLVLGIRWRRFVRDGVLGRKLFFSGAFLVLLSGIIHVFQDKGARGIVDTVGRTLYDNGVIRAGGGFFGGFVGEWMGYVFRLVGTCMLAIPLLLIVGIYLVGLTPSGLWERISYKLRVAEQKRAQRARGDAEEKKRVRNAPAPKEEKTEEEAPVWRQPRAADQVERSAASSYFTFTDEEDEPLRPTRHRELVDIPDDEPTSEKPTETSTAPTPEPLDGHVVDAPFSPQYYQRTVIDERSAATVSGESRVTDAGLGLGYASYASNEEKPTGTAPSTVTQSGFGTQSPETAPRSQNPSVVTDPGFTAERLERMAANNPTPGESRVTEPGFGAARVEIVTAGNRAPGESRVTDAGLGTLRVQQSAAPQSAPVARKEESAADHMDPHITEPPLGLAFGDRYAAVAEHHASIYGGRAAEMASPEALKGTPVAPFGAAPDMLDEDPLLEREPIVATGMPFTPVSPFGAVEALEDEPVGESVRTPEDEDEELFAPTKAQQSAPTASSVTPTYEAAEEDEEQDEPAGLDSFELVKDEEDEVPFVREEVTAPTAPEKRDATIIRREPTVSAAPVAVKTERVKPAPAPEPEPEPPRPYVYPSTELLNEDLKRKNTDYSEEIMEKISVLRQTLADFNIRVKEQVDCSRGPTITRYELRPEAGVSVRSVINRIDDISLNMAAPVRIEAPIPGKPAIGIEVPNATRETVFMRTMLESEAFRASTKPLEVPLGLGIGGDVQMCDLSAMPHLLVAGTTGSGKSVCINTILLGLMFKTSPEDLRLILIDPKQIEFAPYEHVPHLYMPIVTDMQRASGALACAVQEMERRYSLIKDVGVRNIDDYNKAVRNDPEREHLPRIVIVIDEFADLKMSCANNDPENFTCRLAQKARAAGIHLIIGTQRPSVDVITGKLKNNIPSRIAFTVMQQVDSRTILDMNGAESLTGKGDMLYMPTGKQKPARVQGAFVSDGELERVVNFIRRNNEPVKYNQAFMDQIEVEMARAAGNGKKDDYCDVESDDGEDPKFVEAVELAVETQKVATSLLQRRLGVGYGRAAKIIDRMEELGLVSAAEGNKPRKLLPAAQGYLDHIRASDDEEFDDDFEE